MNSNIFKSVPYYKWNSPKNIWDNIKLFFRKFKWGYQRMTRGFADADIWNMDSWLLNILPNSLEHLAEHHWGYPGYGNFSTDEEWTAYLKEMAQLFRQANENNEYYPTPEGDKWWNWIQEHPTKWVEDTIGNKKFKRDKSIEENPYSETMFKEDIENSKKRDADFHKAWDMMGKVFNNLWD